MKFLSKIIQICWFYTEGIYTCLSLGFFWLTANWPNIYFVLNTLILLSSLVGVHIPSLDGELVPPGGVGGVVPVIQPLGLGAVPYNLVDLQVQPQSVPVQVAQGAIPFLQGELLAPAPPQHGSAGAVPFVFGEIAPALQLPPVPFGYLPVYNNIGTGGLPQGPGAGG